MPRQALTARTVPAGHIAPETRAEMFALFCEYYDHVTPGQFAADLAAKDFALLLRDAHGGLAGFTTARCFDFNHAGQTMRVVFSGDTVVAREHWGQQAMARAWLGEMGRIAQAAAGRPLFWFLIVKGHRTYRYLPAFARDFVPKPGGGDDPALLALRDALATDLFGQAFDPASGLIRFARPQGQLAPHWVDPAPRERNLPEVRHFLAANPGHARGDELACLCSLAPENMRPLALRWFRAGYVQV